MKQTLFFIALHFFLPGAGSWAQSLHPLEPIQGRYKMLAALSPEPTADRAWMDTIGFPWSEYGKTALSASLWRTWYLSPEDEAQLPGLVRYPANSSAQTRAELDYLLELQQKRTPEEIKRAQDIADLGSWPDLINPGDPDYAENLRELFYIPGPVIGAWYNPDNFPATTQLLLHCIQDIRVTEFRLKRHFRRARPYHLEPRLQPLARIHSPSFASGHSLWSFTEAYLFSEIISSHRADFLRRAEEVRWSRELMGIHYPSDNEASRVIGWHLLKDWLHNPRFVADLDRARAEWVEKRGRFSPL
ncbi:MAG TPA: phosphatase PAP2 family protein [Bryobacteraceae bacterium]